MPNIVIRFRDDVALALPYEDGLQNFITPQFALEWASLWQELLLIFPDITINKFFRHLTPQEFAKLDAVAKEKAPVYEPYNIFSNFLIPAPETIDSELLITTLLSSSMIVDAYIHHDVDVAEINHPVNPRYTEQSYLKNGPEGVGAQTAWLFTGGDGKGITVTIIEHGWWSNHEDFNSQKTKEIFNKPNSDVDLVDHGVKTLGVIAGSDNGIGIIGIAPNVDEVHFISASNGILVAEAILIAALHSNLAENDHVIQIAMSSKVEQKEGVTPGQRPLDDVPITFQAIEFVTSQLRITVVIAAGNGSADLDAYQVNGKFIYDRNSPDYRDSGAIIVGACTEERKRTHNSNYGSRIDCYATARKALSTCFYDATDPNATKYSEYSGTSCASAIISGVVIALQGMANKQLGKPLTPSEVRALLTHPLLSTPSLKPSDDRIGVMPDLAKLHLALSETKVTLVHQTVKFISVHPAVSAYNAIPFQVSGLKKVNLKLSGLPPQFTSMSGASLEVTPVPSQTVTIEFWLQYFDPASTYVSPQKVTVSCPETGDVFKIDLVVEHKTLPYLSNVLVLDHSGSMNLPAGVPGLTRIQALRDAASAFVTLSPKEFLDVTLNQVLPGNHIGIVTFATEPSVLEPMTYLDGLGLAQEKLVASIVNNSANPDGKTAIGKGLQTADEMLDAHNVPDINPSESIIVFTDGIQNVEPYIKAVIADIPYKVYAIGLGTPQQVNTQALSEITAKTGGFCLLTGELLDNTADYFRLTKYFMQVLCDLTSQQVVTDPDGMLLPDQLVRVPFKLNETEYAVDVVLFTDTDGVLLEIETPSGEVISENRSGVTFGSGYHLRFCKLVLPIKGNVLSHTGQWHARLYYPTATKAQQASTFADTITQRSPTIAARSRLEVRYSLNVYAYSSLTASASLSQADFLPNTPLYLRVVLDEGGLAVKNVESVRAEIQYPDHTRQILDLQAVEPGLYDLMIPTPLVGAYQIRTLVSGYTQQFSPFTREKLLTGAVWTTGQDIIPPGGENTRLRNCLLLALLLILTVAIVNLIILLLIYLS